MKNGSFAEDFTLIDQEGNEFNLFKNLDKKVLLVFYPKDDSPVCTKQLINYNRYIEDFNKLNIKVIGINSGSCNEHKQFCKVIGENIRLLCDDTKSISKKFGALNIFGINKRKLILVGTDKKIIFEKSTLPVKYFKAEQVLKLIKMTEGE